MHFVITLFYLEESGIFSKISYSPNLIIIYICFGIELIFAEWHDVIINVKFKGKFSSVSIYYKKKKRLWRLLTVKGIRNQVLISKS